MPKRLLFLLAAVALVLAACSGQAAPTATPEPSITATSPAATTAPAAVEPTTAGTAEPVADCTVVSFIPTPDPTEASLFPAAGEDDWVLGPEAAEVTLMEYSDFQCPYCSQLAPVLEQLQADYPENVRIVFRNFPLNFHDKALLAAQAAEAAGQQEQYWPMHDRLFEEQAAWAEMTPEQFTAWLGEQAADLGLDVEQFTTDLTSQPIVDKVLADQQNGEEIGIPGTPFLLINGKVWQGPNDYTNLSSLVQVTLLKDRQFTTCPEVTVDPAKQYTATLKTEKGDIVIQLYPDKAPLTVNSFIFLAQQGWYDNVIFHRVVSNPDVAQTGDPTGTGWGGPGYAFRDEINDLKFDKPGVVGMANAGANTNGSQFFIIKSPIPNLDGGYTVFGQVIEGMDVVNSLTPRDPSQAGELPPGDMILGVTIEEK